MSLNSHEEKIAALLDHLLEQEGNEGGVAVQVQFTALMAPGALKRGPVPGTYTLVTFVGEKNSREQPKPTEILFTPAAVVLVMRPIETRIERPPAGLFTR